MKYKVGDWIRVIKRFDPKADYYNMTPCVVKEMYGMQGRCYQILGLTNPSGYYRVFDKAYDSSGNSGYFWNLTDDMIECRVLTFDDGKTFIPYNENMISEEAE